MLKNIVFLLLLSGLIFTGFFIYRSVERDTPDNGISGRAFEPVVVLQLFTSQGCSSCPPADALLRRLGETPGNESVFSIAYHVDYWDYIGWVDPYGRPEHTKKQKEYAAKFSRDQIYTPQLVINGKEHLVGSDAANIHARIQKYLKQPSSNSVTATASKAGEGLLRLDYVVSGPLDGRRIRAVVVLDEKLTHVKHGENRDRKLINTNIAIAEASSLLEDTHGSLVLKLPSFVGEAEPMHIITIAETGDLDITGATRTDLSGDKQE